MATLVYGTKSRDIGDVVGVTDRESPKGSL